MVITKTSDIYTLIRDRVKIKKDGTCIKKGGSGTQNVPSYFFTKSDQGTLKHKINT